jgi:hypothetical protein
MIRKIKVLGLTLVAVFALTAVASASASAAEFHSESSSTELNGAQQTENVFTVNNRTVKCKTATFAGSQSGTTASTVEVHPTYGNCTAFGLESTVTTTGCNYVLHSNGETDIVCAAGKQIEIEAAGTCHVNVAGQSGLKSVSYSNVGSGSTEEVLVTANVGSIKANVSGSTLVCGTNGERLSTYTGSVLTKGSSGGSQVGIRWE